MKIGGWLAAALFVFSAVVQWNDPDPLRWVLAYLAAAALSAAFSLGMAVRLPAALAAPAFAAVAIAVAPSSLLASLEDLVAPEMKTLVIEEARESLGLALCAGWCSVLALRSPARSRKHEETEA